MLKKLSKKIVKTPKQSWAKKFQDLNTDGLKSHNLLAHDENKSKVNTEQEAIGV